MSESSDFSYNIARFGYELVLKLSGDLDAHTTPQLQELVRDQICYGIKRVTIDCDQVLYVDSAFLQFLTNLSDQVQTIRVINASRTIKKIFEITGLDHTYLPDA